MEKTIHRLKNKVARDAYVEAELINGIATQIRVLRQQRGWSQKYLAEKMGTSQGVVSRLEDPSYGRFSIKTLISLAGIFDVSLLTRFVPFSVMISATWDTSSDALKAESFESEITKIQFVSKYENRYLSQEISTSDVNYLSKNYIDIDGFFHESLDKLSWGDFEDASLKYFVASK